MTSCHGAIPCARSQFSISRWIASTVPYREPWNGTAPTPKDVVNGVKWELFDLTKDWTQNNDLSASNPDKLKELQDLFWVEAASIRSCRSMPRR